MKTVSIDTGVEEFQINGKGILRFNPSDINVYNRFMESQEAIEQLEEEYVQKTEGIAAQSDEKGFPQVGKLLAVTKELDSRVKERLSYVFGEQNDFDAIFEGVNLLAVTGNGERVITNFFQAFTPIIEKGISRYADARAKEAAEKAETARKARKARSPRSASSESHDGEIAK